MFDNYFSNVAFRFLIMISNAQWSNSKKVLFQNTKEIKTLKVIYSFKHIERDS